MKRASIVALGFLSMLCMAPTAGDVGGCGTTPTALDPGTFEEARKAQDCERCRDCGLTTQRCTNACDPSQPPETSLPKSCLPLLHDGEVCLRALHAASCDAYATYVDPVAPATPSECDFCKVPPLPGALPIFLTDAGANEGGPDGGHP